MFFISTIFYVSLRIIWYNRDLKLVDWILIEFKGQEISKGNIGVFDFPRK